MTANSKVTKKPATKKTVTKKTSTKDETKEEKVVKTEETKTTEKSKSKKSSAPKKERTRRVVTKESLRLDFDTLQKRIEEEIERLRGSAEKVKGVKFLRSINKALKTLKSDSERVQKIKKKSNHQHSANSGFMKPVKISPEMSNFTGFNNDTKHSRVEITKFICAYIKNNNLQDPSDRRNIVCDEKLKNLLKYDSKDKLTYFRLQQCIQCHFIKEPKEGVTAAAKEKPVKEKVTKKAASNKPPKKEDTPAADDDEVVDVEESEE